MITPGQDHSDRVAARFKKSPKSSSSGAFPRKADALSVAALALTGRLRASINLGNPILANKDPSTGQAVSVSVDLARAFARLLDVDIELLVFDAALKSVDAVAHEQANTRPSKTRPKAVFEVFCAIWPRRAPLRFDLIAPGPSVVMIAHRAATVPSPPAEHV